MPKRIPAHDTPGDSPRGGAVVALMFWACLFVSATLYGVWAQAPRFVEWIELKHEYRSNQAELSGLQDQLRHLQRVADALQRDPDFAARVARRELDAVRPGAETIRVPDELGIDPRVPAQTVTSVPEALPWYLPALRNVANDKILRRRTILAATGLVLVAFVLLNDGTIRVLRSVSTPGIFFRRVFARYIRQDQPS